MSIIIRYALYIAAGYALLVSAAFLAQRSLIYHPDSAKPAADHLSALGLRFWPQVVDYKGLIGTQAPQPTIGTVMVFHGNAGSAWHRGYYVKALEPLGYRVILAEYPGYAGREGKLNETRIVEDAKASIAAAGAEFGDTIYLIGESMGCGVAAAAVADQSLPVKGLVLVTPWDSLAAVAQSHYWYLPAKKLIKDRFDSIANLHGFEHPVAVAMAEKDTVIPQKHTMALYEALDTPKRLWRFQDAGHNDWPTHPSAPWWRETMAFISTGDYSAPNP